MGVFPGKKKPRKSRRVVASQQQSATCQRHAAGFHVKKESGIKWEAKETAESDWEARPASLPLT